MLETRSGPLPSAISQLPNPPYSTLVYLLGVPDGIEIELYTDEDPAIWKRNPQAVATIKPLAI